MEHLLVLELLLLCVEGRMEVMLLLLIVLTKGEV
jgi:hypothetical protein